MTHALLFQPLTLREVTFANRIVISPMCQYSARDGMATDWHLVNAGRFAMGGAGAVVVEATAVSESGRGTPGDLGLWRDEQVAPLARIATFLAENGAVPGIQLNHAGRKGARRRPWHGGTALDAADEARGEPAWNLQAPTAAPAFQGGADPTAFTTDELAVLTAEWVAAARRAAGAGFRFLELHMAHGYLLHQFLSPLVNDRTDGYGGDLAARMRFPLEVATAVRAAWPAALPLFVRISATEWAESGWAVDDSVAFASALRERGVDLVDCSSGGMMVGPVPNSPGYQVPFAERIRKEAGVATMAVGLIRGGEQAEAILAAGSADLIAIGREALVEPNWALRARAEVEATPSGFLHWPAQSGWWLERRKLA